MSKTTQTPGPEQAEETPNDQSPTTGAPQPPTTVPFPEMLRVRPPGWGTPPPSSGADETAAGSGAVGDSPGMIDEPLEPPSTKSSSSSRSSAAEKRLLNDTEATLREAIAAGIASAGENLHELRARDEHDDDAGIWLSDEQDQQGIAKPTASMIRRNVLEGLELSPDVADGIELAIAVGTYVVKQINKHLEARRNRRAAAMQAAAEGPADAA